MSVGPSVHSTVRPSACDDSTVCMSAHPSVHSCLRPPVCLSVCPSVRPSVRLSVRLSVCPSVCYDPTVRMSVRPSIRFYVRPSIHPSNHPFLRPCIRPSVCPPIRPSDCSVPLISPSNCSSIFRLTVPLPSCPPTVCPSHSLSLSSHADQSNPAAPSCPSIHRRPQSEMDAERRKEIMVPPALPSSFLVARNLPASHSCCSFIQLASIP